MKNNREVNTTSMPLSLNYTMIAKGELGGTLAPWEGREGHKATDTMSLLSMFFLLFLNHVYIYGYMHVGMCTWMQELEEARKGNWAHQHFPGAWVAGSLLVWVMETELRTSARAVCGFYHRVISPALMSIFTRKYLNRRCPELYTN